MDFLDFNDFEFNDRSPKQNLPDNQLLLPNGKLITFNSEQFDGVKKINHWLRNGNKNLFTLAGYAGTGKSTIIKKILDNYHGGVVVSAPTHKAKKVVIKTTKRFGMTLHGLLGLRPDVELDDFNPNDPKFNPIAPPRITDYNFVIIDEASMINQDLYNLIIEKLKNRRTRVLFMGDPAQIPPVGEVVSAVFHDNSIDLHQLTKIERQKDTNPLAFIYDALRNNLEDIDGGFERITQINEYGEGIKFTVNKKEFRNSVLEKFMSDEYKRDTDYVKGIAWRNDTVMAANKVIRDEMFGDKNGVIEVGDILMGYRTISSADMKINIIENSADYKVVYKSKQEENAYGIKGFQVKIKEDLTNNEYAYKDIFIVDSSDYDNLHLYGEMHDFLKEIAIKNKKMWNKYYDFRRNNMIMVNIKTYRNGLSRSKSEEIAKDLDYGYFITGHKSQGSTYEHVMVMENDINGNFKIKERNQIKYVAFTRPTTTATVLSSKIAI